MGKQTVDAVSAIPPPRDARHVVLYARSEPTAGWRPVASHPAGDPGIAEDFAALRIEKINEARRSGAPRPEFVEQNELNGEPEVTL